ncbi:hypothetical protein C8Q73DRAFT_713357 [Cubamyces lactineus]|nr:hypothetical protein C8Q73DRAFT_713357 [Cubamyces lactineus]
MSTRSKTPTSSKQLGQHDHTQTTPTRRRSAKTHAQAQAHASSTSNYLPRRNSWEDEIQVTSLPDPRTPEHLSYNDIWKGPYMELAQDAAAEFMRELQVAMRSRPREFRVFHDMLQRSARENRCVHRTPAPLTGFADGVNRSVEIDRVLDMACQLFGYHAEQSYIAVFTPDGGWFEFPDGRRQFHGAISSSTR